MQGDGSGNALAETAGSLLISARVVSTSASSSPFTPVGHSLHVAVVNLAQEDIRDEKQEGWMALVDGQPRACPDHARGSAHLLGLKLVLRNFVSMAPQIESAVVVVDAFRHNEIVLSLCYGDDVANDAPESTGYDEGEHVGSSSSCASSGREQQHRSGINDTLRVKVRWHRHVGLHSLQQQQPRSVRPATGGAQRSAATVQLQQRQLPGWTTSTLFTYGPNHTRWVPTDDAKSRVLLNARVKDSPRMLLMEAEPSVSSSPGGAKNSNNIRPPRLVASARSSRSQPQVSAAKFPILVRPPPQQTQKHHHHAAAETSPADGSAEAVAWKHQDGRRIVATETRRTTHGETTEEEDAKRSQEVHRQANTATGVNSRLYTPQKTDPSLVAASWRRKLTGLREESEHMEIYLDQAKLLDGLFLPNTA